MARPHPSLRYYLLPVGRGRREASVSLIFHLTTRDDWVRQVWTPEYRHPSLKSEGFIHASTAEQVVATANRYYAGRSDMALISIDTARLKSDLRWELAASLGEEFPHIYGPVNLDAVTQALDIKPEADGRFVGMPPGIDFDSYSDSVWLRAQNFDGVPHWGHPALRVQVSPELVITRTGFASIVARENGAFTSNWATRGHYWPDRWYNVIRLDSPERGLDGFYCNIAQPLPFDGSTVRYVDLQLDVRVFVESDGSLNWRLLDEDEFQEARDHYGYDDELIRRCYEAVDQVIAAVKARDFPFNG